MSYHRSGGVLPDVAATRITVPVLPQADCRDFLSLYTIIQVDEFGEAKDRKAHKIPVCPPSISW